MSGFLHFILFKTSPLSEFNFLILACFSEWNLSWMFFLLILKDTFHRFAIWIIFVQTNKFIRQFFVMWENTGPNYLQTVWAIWEVTTIFSIRWLFFLNKNWPSLVCMTCVFLKIINSMILSNSTLNYFVFNFFINISKKWQIIFFNLLRYTFYRDSLYRLVLCF